MRRILLAIVWVPLLTAAGLEVGARVIGRLNGKPWDSAVLHADLQTTAQSLSRRAFIPGGRQDDERAHESPTTLILQPFTSWEHMSTQELIAQDSEYYASPRAEQAVDICVLGGSVAQTFAMTGRARLAELLRPDPHIRGHEVMMHNYACAGYKQPQQVMFLSYLLALGHKPDIVIELDGFNEVALGWTNGSAGVHPAYPYLPFWSNVMMGLRPDWEWAELTHDTHERQDRAIAFGDWFIASGLWRSCFLGRIGRVHLERLRQEYTGAFARLHNYVTSRPKDAELKGPRFPSNEQAIARIIIRYWEDCSISLQGVCTAHHIAYLHVLQPTLHDDGSKPLTEREIAGSAAEPGWIAGVKRLYPLLRTGGARLAQHGVAFLDATGIFREDPEELYIDSCHLNQRGNDLLAEAVAPAVIDLLRRGQ